MILPKSKKLILATVLLFVVFSLVSPQLSFAQTSPPPDTSTPSAVGTVVNAASIAMPGVAVPLAIYSYFTDDGPSLAQKLVWSLVATVTGLWLGLGALILNFGINDFLIGFGKTFGDTGIGVGVDTTWATVRDFVNLTFIFGLVYIGFKMILDNNDSNTKRWLAGLIMAALLVNFSLFITKTVIEVSNQFAIKIIENGFPVDLDENGNVVVDTSGSLMQRLGLVGILGNQQDVLEAVGGDKAWGFIFGTGILFIIAGFVFAAGGILLIIRFAILNFYMVMSPVLFLGFILPPLAGSINKYWEKFIAKCFFAPIYILLLYFSFRILDGMASPSAGGSGRFAPNGTAYRETLGISNTGSIQEASTSTLPFFILTCFFLIGSLVIAEKLGAEGAGKAVGIMKDVKNSAQKRVENSAKWTGKQAAIMTTAIPRQQARRATAFLGNEMKYKIKKLQDGKQDTLVRRLARSNFSTDYALGAAAAMEHVQYGTGRDQETSDFLLRATKLESGRRQSATAGQSAMERMKQVRNHNRYLDENGNDISDTLSEEEKQVYENDRQKEIDAADALAKDITYAEFKKMSHQHRKLLAPFVKPSVLEAHLNDSDVDKVERDDVEAHVRKNIEERIFHTATGADGKQIQIANTDEMKRLTANQLDILGQDFINEYIDVLTDSQVQNIGKAGIYSETGFRDLQEKRKNKLRKDMEKLEELADRYNIDPTMVVDPETGEEKATYPQLLSMVENMANQEEAEFIRAAMPLLKTKYKKGKKGWYLNTKAEETKKLPKQTHSDVFKQPGWERYADKNWLAANIQADRDFSGMDYGDRLKFIKNVEGAANNRGGSYTPHQVKQAKELKEMLDDPRTRKNFLGREDGAYDAKDEKRAASKQAAAGNDTEHNYDLKPGETVSEGGLIIPPSTGNGPRES
jgi:hypothetical protein